MLLRQLYKVRQRLQSRHGLFDTATGKTLQMSDREIIDYFKRTFPLYKITAIFETNDDAQPQRAVYLTDKYFDGAVVVNGEKLFNNTRKGMRRN